MGYFILQVTLYFFFLSCVCFFSPLTLPGSLLSEYMIILFPLQCLKYANLLHSQCSKCKTAVQYVPDFLLTLHTGKSNESTYEI